MFFNTAPPLISKEDWIELLICSRDVFLKPKILPAAILERPPGRLRLYTNHSLESVYRWQKTGQSALLLAVGNGEKR